MSKTPELKAGDVVRLRSGSPQMTVIGAAPPDVGQGYVIACWFVREEVRQITSHSAAFVLVHRPEEEEAS